MNDFNYKNGRKDIKEEIIRILGLAYKKDIDDQRESPSLRIMQILKGKGAKVDYHDPLVPVCRGHRHYPDIDMKSVKLTPTQLKEADVVLLLTDHSAYDYKFIAKNTACIVDTRNAFGSRGIISKKIIR
ncbi:hypothetical protein KKB54_04405 [bacterium]|nr:hypothetical protein [bacterium]MBU1152384.1 hypothetical protein [bacterium]